MSDTSKYGTPFVESELVLAASAEDMGEVQRLLGTMLRGEIAALVNLLGEVRTMASQELGTRIAEGKE